MPDLDFRVDQVVNAMLYEGYILYPYRASSTKNRARFTFGRVYPEAYSIGQHGAEPFIMQTECLVESSAVPVVEVSVRFLHPMAREVGALATEHSQPEWLPELRVDGRLYQTWQEAVERTVTVPPQSLPGLAEHALESPFTFPSSLTTELIRNESGQVVGILTRRQESLQGRIEVTATSVDARVWKIAVRIVNQTPIPESELNDHDKVIMRTFASTHTVLRVRDGAFHSLLDPPPDYVAAAAACNNTGAWPVLVGDEKLGERGTMLSSPIILYDYPRIAPESPGDLFDGTEIDEILTLRVMAMTDAEKSEMRQVDDFARRILERTESLTGDHMMKMHGAMRDMRAFDEEFATNTRLECVSVRGVSVKAGDHVRIHPKGRADVMDLALAGKTAVIEAIEQDAEARIHLALVLDDDPGKDLGMMRQPGHRFFYGTDEVEPLNENLG
jgi:hydrogenase maturation protease